ncbi:hypothetical protein L2E82_32742 [Cichorium intybus]|uniref:Uncharacterized protein n=1 Tax=Cichorium intybus TaxID=13427 RepID=A0ACB9BGR3_CICIN|nr:hypothetical protein L2E82_32742 [Cichorium intybus]
MLHKVTSNPSKAKVPEPKDFLIVEVASLTSSEQTLSASSRSVDDLIGVLIEDKEVVESLMGGNPWKAGKFASSLCLSLWSCRWKSYLLHEELLRRCVESGVSYVSSEVEKIIESPNATVSLNVKTISPLHAEATDIKGFFGETNSVTNRIKVIGVVFPNFEELHKERHDIKSYGKGRRSAFLKDVYASPTVKFEVEIQPQNPINLARVRPQM